MIVIVIVTAIAIAEGMTAHDKKGQNVLYQKNKIKRIYLMLGSACNFNCRYCIQSGEFQGYRHETKQEINPDVYAYIHSIEEARKKKKDKLTIMYWGGEPLLYFDTIKKVIPRFPNTEHAIVSNGSLLTQEIVDYINAYHVHYVVSNDGPNTDKTRITNILEDEVFLSLFRQIRSRGVDSVISAYCQDYQALEQYITDRCGQETAQDSEFLLPSVIMPEDAYHFDYEKYRQSLRMRLEHGIAGILSGNMSQDFIKTSLYLHIFEHADEITMPRCSQMDTILNVDLQGNIYACHNSTIKIGTIYDDEITLSANYRAYLEEQRILEKKGCANCEAYELCKGGCLIIEPEAHGQEACCRLRRVYAQEVKRAYEIISKKILAALGNKTGSLDEVVKTIHEQYKEEVKS